MIQRRALVVNFLTALVWPSMADAHVSEMGFVLLMPTELYIGAGGSAVLLTVVALAFVPPRLSERLIRPLTVKLHMELPRSEVFSLASLVVFAALVGAGFFGVHDPLHNPLSLTIWTVWWVVLPILQGVFGDIWSAINPWTGLYRMLVRRPKYGLPDRIGSWPAVCLLLIFALFALADPAPDDPSRLAGFALVYWLSIFAGMLIFGETWRKRCEFFTVLMHLVAGLSPFRTIKGRWQVALPGWRLLRLRRFPTSAGCLALLFLAVGSFDGLNETFWWLALIGVNPLEFPGRSALQEVTVFGLLALTAILFAAFAFCTRLGLYLAKSNLPLKTAFAPLALATLPIAFAYHFAHYLVSALINLQYTMLALLQLAGLPGFYVTTGFLNRADSVAAIFTAQAGAVVVGHVLAVLLAHSVALRLFEDRRQAVISQIPMASFMVAYTFLGLWLLATPKGA